MKLKPLTQWYCDTCGEIILEPSHGWLEWLHDDLVPHSFRICHHVMHSPTQRADEEGCYKYGKHPRRADMHLDAMIGPDGMASMLSLLDRRAPGERVITGSFEAKAIADWVHIVRRMFTPNFEDARMYFEKAEDDGFFAGCNEVWPYTQDTLLEIIRRYGE
jgi:hypothetical protein